MSEFEASLFYVKNHEDRGKILIANDDFKVGAEIYRENAVLFVSFYQQDNKSHVEAESKTSIRRDLWALYAEFKKLTQNLQEEILTLFGPVSGAEPERYTKILRASQYKDEVDIESFVKVAMVLKFNGITTEPNKKLNSGGVGIYSTSTLVAHSCAPNCTSFFNGGTRNRSIRSLRLIQKGEELTFSYCPEIALKPQNERRQFIQTSGLNFTCTCERCIRSGDDTRQFNCLVNATVENWNHHKERAESTSSCPGRHLIFQPLNELTVRPYLLPCAVCKQSPTEAVNDLVIDSERDLIHKLKQLRHSTTVKNKVVVYDETLLLSPYHYTSIEILTKQIEYHMRMEHFEHCISLCHQLISCVETILPLFPSDDLADVLTQVAEHALTIGTVEAVLFAKEYSQRALRLRMLLHGSDGAPEAAFTQVMEVIKACSDPKVVEVTAKLPALPSSDSGVIEEEKIGTAVEKLDIGKDADVISSLNGVVCCYVCGVDPQQCVVLGGLKKCGKCRQVEYCSGRCQKAHWKLHKGQCK